MAVYWIDPFLHCSTQGNGTTGTAANGTYANPWGWSHVMTTSLTSWGQRVGVTFQNNDEIRIKGLPFATLTHSVGDYDLTINDSPYNQIIAPTSSNTNTNTVTDFFFVKGADVAPWHPDGANTHIHCFAADAGLNSSNPRGWNIMSASISAWSYLEGVSPFEVFCLKPEYIGTYGWTNSDPNATYYYMPHSGSTSIRIDISAGWDSETTQDGISVFQGEFTNTSTSYPRVYWGNTNASNRVSYDCEKLYISTYRTGSSNRATSGNYMFSYNAYMYFYTRARSSDSNNPIKQKFGGVYSYARLIVGNYYSYSYDYFDAHYDYINTLAARLYAPGINNSDLSYSFLNSTWQNTIYMYENGSLGSYSSTNYGTITMGTTVQDRYGGGYHMQQSQAESEGNGCIDTQYLDRTRINFEQNAIMAFNGRRASRSWTTSTAFTNTEKLFSHRRSYPGTNNQMYELYPPVNLNTIKRFDATSGVMTNFASGRWDSPLYYSQVDTGQDFEASSQAAFPSHWTDPQFKVASSFAGENVALMGKLTCGGNDYRTTQPTISLVNVTDPNQAPHATLVYLCPSNDYDNHPVAFIPGTSAPGTVINNSSGHFEMLLPSGNQTFYMMFKNTVSYASGDVWYKPVIQGYGQNLSSSCHMTFRYFYLNSSYNHDKQNTDQDVTIPTSAGEFMRSSTSKEEQMYEQPIDGSEMYVLLTFAYVDSGASYGSQKLFITSADTGNSITQAEYDAL